MQRHRSRTRSVLATLGALLLSVLAAVTASVSSARPAAAATCSPTLVTVRVLSLKANNIDDLDGDDEAKVIGQARATPSGAAGASVTSVYKIHAGETVTFPADEQVVFRQVVGANDTVKVNLQAWDTDGGLFGRVPPWIRQAVEAQAKEKVVATFDTAWIAAYLTSVGINYFQADDKLANVTFDVPACGEPVQTWTRNFRYSDILGKRNYDMTYQVERVTAVCRGKLATIFGTNADDVLVGTNTDDVIVAGGGADTVDGFGGNDTICGGAGPDRITGGDGDDALLGDDGHDFLAGNAGRDRIEAGNGNDVLQGGRDEDQLFGGAGDDVLTGGLGADALFGEAGLDTLQHSNGTDDDQTADTLDGGTNGAKCAYTALDVATRCTSRI